MDALTKLLPRKKAAQESQLYYGKGLDSVPLLPVAPWSLEVISAYTGPNTGLVQLGLFSDTLPTDTCGAIAGSTDWNSPTEYAFGCATSLYEEDKRDLSSDRSQAEGYAAWHRPPILAGEPVADVFGIQVRENSAILALADGVSWGVKSRLSARCAVHAVMDHVSSNLSSIERKPDSHTIIQLLLHSVTTTAQQLILEKKATLTTLSAVIVCEMATKRGEWGLFVVAVGDSPVYVYCPHTKSLMETTVGLHPHSGERDVRMAGGVLGPACGSQPDLENLTVAYMPVYEGDIVFSTSDGISDNFRSQVSTKLSTLNPKLCVGKGVPKLKPCCENITHMNDVLTKHQEVIDDHLSAQTIVATLINRAFEVTESKRQFRSDCLLHNIDIRRKSKEDPQFACKVKALTGKLDHATVVAYQVGRHY